LLLPSGTTRITSEPLALDRFSTDVVLDNAELKSLLEQSLKKKKKRSSRKKKKAGEKPDPSEDAE